MRLLLQVSECRPRHRILGCFKGQSRELGRPRPFVERPVDAGDKVGMNFEGNVPLPSVVDQRAFVRSLRVGITNSAVRALIETVIQTRCGLTDCDRRRRERAGAQPAGHRCQPNAHSPNPFFLASTPSIQRRSSVPEG